jgi:hypothetical protein
MIHEDLVNQIILQNLKEGDLVEIVLKDEVKIKGVLNSGKVYGDEISGEIKNSRIGLLPPPPPPGKIYSQMITTVYSVNIVTINKVK